MRCSYCKKNDASHKLWKADAYVILCCECYVGAGYPPADWHSACMKAYNDGDK